MRIVIRVQCLLLLLSLLPTAIAVSFAPFTSSAVLLRQEGVQRQRPHGGEAYTSGTAQLGVQIGGNGSSCACSFQGACSCHAALEFMQCAKAACESGSCMCMDPDTGMSHFQAACSSLASSCSSVGLQCQPSRAECPVAGGKRESVSVPFVSRVWEESEKQMLKSHGHHLVSCTLLSVLGTLLIVFSMAASSNKLLSKHAWLLIDVVCIVFIVFTVYFMMDTIFEAQVHGSQFQKSMCHIVWAVSLFAVASKISFQLRDDDVNLKCFNEGSVRVVAFAMGGAIAEFQANYSKSLWGVTCAYCGITAVFVLVMFVSHKLKPAQGWWDDVETNLLGAALGAGFVLLTKMAIHGDFHNFMTSKDAGLKPAIWQTCAFTLFAAVTVLLAVYGAPPLKKRVAAMAEQHRYWMGRLSATGVAFIGCLPNFTVAVSLEQVVLHHIGLPPASVLARLVTAVISTAMGLTLLLLCAFVPCLKRAEIYSQSWTAVLLLVGGFWMAMSWAHLLTQAVHMACQGMGYTPTQQYIHTTVLILCMDAIVIPAYVCFLKPAILRGQKS